MSTMHDTLDAAVHATHEVLAERLRKASAAFTTATGRRDVYRLTDTFLASTSMHLAAVNAVLLPAAKKHLPDGPAHVRAVVRQCRRLELALSQTKARLYGESHAIHRLWEDVWQHVGREFGANIQLERALVDDLMDHLDTVALDRLATRIYRTELRSPTRPHPYTPHTGLSGRVSRRAWASADRFWDVAEGRMVPEPVRAQELSRNGLVALPGDASGVGSPPRKASGAGADNLDSPPCGRRPRSDRTTHDPA